MAVRLVPRDAVILPPHRAKRSTPGDKTERRFAARCETRHEPQKTLIKKD